MNNLYNGHEFKLNLGNEIKRELEPSNMECICCGLKIQCALFYSDETLRFHSTLVKKLSEPCSIKRPQ